MVGTSCKTYKRHKGWLVPAVTGDGTNCKAIDTKGGMVPVRNVTMYQFCMSPTDKIRPLSKSN